ncbi:hypothetical protein SALBM311S_13074 [Streptomyces alboniger]
MVTFSILEASISLRSWSLVRIRTRFEPGMERRLRDKPVELGATEDFLPGQTNSDQ